MEIIYSRALSILAAVDGVVRSSSPGAHPQRKFSVGFFLGG